MSNFELNQFEKQIDNMGKSMKLFEQIHEKFRIVNTKILEYFILIEDYGTQSKPIKHITSQIKDCLIEIKKLFKDYNKLNEDTAKQQLALTMNCFSKTEKPITIDDLKTEDIEQIKTILHSNNLRDKIPSICFEFGEIKAKIDNFFRGSFAKYTISLEIKDFFQKLSDFFKLYDEIEGYTEETHPDISSLGVGWKNIQKSKKIYLSLSKNEKKIIKEYCDLVDELKGNLDMDLPLTKWKLQKLTLLEDQILQKDLEIIWKKGMKPIIRRIKEKS